MKDVLLNACCRKCSGLQPKNRAACKPDPTVTSCCSPTNLTQQWPPAVLPQTWPNSHLLLFSHKPDPAATFCCSSTNLTQWWPAAVFPTNLTEQPPPAVLPQTWPNGDLLLFSHKPDPTVTSCCSPTRRCLKKFWQVNDLCRRGKQTQTTGTHMMGTELPTPTTSAQ